MARIRFTIDAEVEDATPGNLGQVASELHGRMADHPSIIEVHQPVIAESILGGIGNDHPMAPGR